MSHVDQYVTSFSRTNGPESPRDGRFRHSGGKPGSLTRSPLLRPGSADIHIFMHKMYVGNSYQIGSMQISSPPPPLIFCHPPHNPRTLHHLLEGRLAARVPRLHHARSPRSAPATSNQIPDLALLPPKPAGQFSSLHSSPHRPLKLHPNDHHQHSINHNERSTQPTNLPRRLRAGGPRPTPSHQPSTFPQPHGTPAPHAWPTYYHPSPQQPASTPPPAYQNTATTATPTPLSAPHTDSTILYDANGRPLPLHQHNHTFQRMTHGSRIITASDSASPGQQGHSAPVVFCCCPFFNYISTHLPSCLLAVVSFPIFQPCIHNPTFCNRPLTATQLVSPRTTKKQSVTAPTHFTFLTCGLVLRTCDFGLTSFRS